jgi:hypothetical protein
MPGKFSFPGASAFCDVDACRLVRFNRSSRHPFEVAELIVFPREPVSATAGWLSLEI